MTLNDLIATPKYQSRNGRVQVAEYNLGKRYICTERTFFPKPFDFKGEIETHFWFCANYGKDKSIFGEFAGKLMEDPYEEGYYFIVCKSDEHANQFLQSPIFELTYDKRIQ